ncbi:MAG TPA: hypothetical protein VGM19_04830 [Armatimonadota bacterium]|jgi:hypothetical protein
MQLDQLGDKLTLTAAAYVLEWCAADPWFCDVTADGFTWRLCLAAGVHQPEALDAVGVPSLAGAETGAAETELRFSLSSSLWQELLLVVRCREQDLDLQAVVSGAGEIERVSLLEGVIPEKLPHPRSTMVGLGRTPRPLEAYAIASPARHQTVFCPQPESYHRPQRPFWEDGLVTAACTFGPDTFNTYFSPGIFCFVLGDAAEEHFCAVGVVAPPGENRYHSFRYHGGESFGFTLEYDGMTAVSGRWESPRLLLGWARDHEAALCGYVGDLYDRGYARHPQGRGPAWWREPIFCGWGQQEHWSRFGERGGKLDFSTGTAAPGAADLATEASYREMVRRLAEADLPYGTLIIDDRWGLSEALPEVDPAKWDDLRSFIRELHVRGKKVLLWMSCWSTFGTPEPYLMRRAEGLKPAVDPTAPGFAEALTARITELISPDGYDADGFKLDFTGDLPRGHGYRPHQPLWGVELLRYYVEIIHRAMKAAKPDAMLETQCANPYFAEVTDVLRLNDIFFETLEVNEPMAFRARMAAIACPEWPLDCDNDPFADRESWLSYLRLQPDLGIPSLYTITDMSWSASGQEVRPEDLAEIRELWQQYRRDQGLG